MYNLYDNPSNDVTRYNRKLTSGMSKKEETDIRVELGLAPYIPTSDEECKMILYVKNCEAGNFFLNEKAPENKDAKPDPDMLYKDLAHKYRILLAMKNKEYFATHCTHQIEALECADFHHTKTYSDFVLPLVPNIAEFSAMLNLTTPEPSKT